MLKKVPLDIKELNSKLQNFARLNGHTLEIIDNNDHKIYKFHNESMPGLLRIYNTRKGLTIDSGVGKNNHLNSQIIDYLKEAISKKNTDEERLTLKNITHIEFNNILEDINIFISHEKDLSLFKLEINNPNLIEKVRVIDNTSKEEIILEYFSNSTLYLYGFTWNLGEEVINIICRVTERVVYRNFDALNEIVHFCNENYINDNGYSCTLCSNICTGNCRELLRRIHYGGKERYSCERVINYYILRYIYKFAYEIERHLYDYSNTIQDNEELNILSIGCGPSSDLFGFENYNKSLDEHKTINYIGIDLNRKWFYIHEKLKSKSQHNQKINYIYEDIFEYIDQINPFRKRLKTNILILQYVISDMAKYNSEKEMHNFFDRLMEDIILYMPNNSMVIINDINNYELSNKYFDYIANILHNEDYIIDKRYYESKYRATASYGEAIVPIKVPYKIEEYIEKRYNPHIECSSSSLIIRKV